MQGKTGYPSQDMPWLKYYKEGAYEKSLNPPIDKTVWDVIEERLKEYSEIPAIEYFNNRISRPEFIDLVYTWARTFKALGVEPDEVVPIYSPFFPDICAMTFSLNAIGATPYFLKLAISPKALEEETRESSIAVVFDEMWQNVAHEFSKEKYKNVIVVTAKDSLPNPKKQIVSFLSIFKSKKNKSKISNDKKYICVDKAKAMASHYTGDVKVPFKPNRNAFITSSSGTTVGGVVKGVVATNETTLAQLYAEENTTPGYHPGERCLTNFPPTASTSLNCLFMMPLYKGLVVVNDPRVSEKDFYKQVMNLKPSVVFTTGSMWETFFNRIETQLKLGKKINLDFASLWAVGGEGIDPRKFDSWVNLFEKCNAENALYSGYGSSEFFAVVSGDTTPAMSNLNKDRKVLGVGIPYSGINIGVFDEDGKELPYNKRGELWVTGLSGMKGYYNKPKLTEEVKHNNWIKSGDLAHIDEDGFLYIWGRTSEKISTKNGEDIYLFDVANVIKENKNIDDAIVLHKPLKDDPNTLTAHIVWKDTLSEKDKYEQLICVEHNVENYLPEDIKVIGYAEYDKMLPYSPTTLKKDKNSMSKRNDLFKLIVDNVLYDETFIEINNDGVYEVNKNKIDIIINK